MIWRVTWGDAQERVLGMARFTTRYDMHACLCNSGWSLHSVVVLERKQGTPIPISDGGWVQLDIMEATPCELQRTSGQA